VPDGAWFRDLILERYDFTRAARVVLREIPVEVEDVRQPLGGGLWYPNERRIVLKGVQDEACLHELVHAWADATGFYTDPHPDEPGKLGCNFAFRRDVDHAARETDPSFRRIAFLAWEYTFGNPHTGFPGMRELDWERFAGLASGAMGDTRLMPPYLRRWYAPLFGGHPAIPGPSGLPPWAPPGWRQGDEVAMRVAQPPAAPRGISARLRGVLRRFVT
jgi:hypothetical protein